MPSSSTSSTPLKEVRGINAAIVIGVVDVGMEGRIIAYSEAAPTGQAELRNPAKRRKLLLKSAKLRALFPDTRNPKFYDGAFAGIVKIG